MKKLLLFFILIGFLGLSCTAAVKIAKYPGKNITYTPESQCEIDYEHVRVLGQLPPAEEYEEIGYMIVKQEASSSLYGTSDEEQIKAARIQACQWGADAIVITGSEADKGTTYDFWSGSQYHDVKSNRIIAIKLIEPEN